VILLFLFFSYIFYPIAIINLWNIGNYNGISGGIKVVLTGFIAVLLSMFILTPIILRSSEHVNEKKISLILEKVTNQMKFDKTPKVFRIRTAQLNAISFYMINKKSLGLTTGLLEAFRNNQLNEQELECIFAYLLSYYSNQNIFKRYFMYGIPVFYNSIGYIFIYLGRGFYRLAEMTEQRGYKIFAWLSGFLCILAGKILRVPEKICSFFAFPLIYNFQRNADFMAKKITNQETLQSVLQKIDGINKDIDKRLTILPNPEYWFVKPINLLRIDKLFLFRIPQNKRIK